MGKFYEEILWGSVMGKRCGVMLWELLWGNVMGECYGKI